MTRRQCPKCKVVMDHQTLVGVEFESCPSCSGVWLDRGELKALTRSRGGQALEVSVAHDVRTEYLCPHCKPPSLLYEGKHSLSHDFLLDICRGCGGLWFDRGEFPSLLKSKG